jgi:hypothetical protein
MAESPVCPYCGMTTWVNGSCALPGCEGHALNRPVEQLPPIATRRQQDYVLVDTGTGNVWAPWPVPDGSGSHTWKRADPARLELAAEVVARRLREET